MRRLLLFVVLCLLAIASTGCKKARLRVQLKELMGSTIVLPEKIACVYNGEVYPMPDSLRDKPKLIVYVDSTECSTCFISHIGIYRNVFDLSKRTGLFDVLILLRDTTFKSIPLVQYISDQEIEFPLYVDSENLFPIINPLLLPDMRFHSVLVDNKGRPLLFGDPARSVRVLDLFKRRFINN